MSETDEKLINFFNSIIGKYNLSKSEKIKIKKVIDKIYLLDRHFEQKHYDYLLKLIHENKFFFTKEEIYSIKFSYRYSVINEKIDFDSINFDDLDFNTNSVPFNLFETEKMRKRLMEYFKNNKGPFIISALDIGFLEIDDKKNIKKFFVETDALGQVPLSDFIYIREILKIGFPEFEESSLNRAFSLGEPPLFQFLHDYFMKKDDAFFKFEYQMKINKVINSTEFNSKLIKPNAILKLEDSEYDLKMLALLQKDSEINNRVIIEGFKLDFNRKLYEERKKIYDLLKQLKNPNRVLIKIDKGVKAGRMSLRNYLQMVGYYDRLAEKIKGMDMSPFEQYLYAFNLAKSFKKYCFYRNNKQADEAHYELSRNPYLILKNKWIVCSGFVKYLREILSRLEIECYESDYIENHDRIYAFIKDPKYNLNQVIMGDPTWNNLSEYSYNYSTLSVSKEDYEDLDEFRKFRFKHTITNFKEVENEEQVFEMMPRVSPRKVLIAIRNIKKKEKKYYSLSDLDIYNNKALQKFLSSSESIKMFEYYFEEDRVNELVQLLSDYPHQQISILNSIILELDSDLIRKMFDNIDIKSVIMTNSKKVSWEAFRKFPLEFKIEILNAEFAKHGLKIEDFNYNSKIEVTIYGRKFAVDEEEMNKSIASFVTRVSKISMLHKIRNQLIDQQKNQEIELSALKSYK